MRKFRFYFVQKNVFMSAFTYWFFFSQSSKSSVQSFEEIFLVRTQKKFKLDTVLKGWIGVFGVSVALNRGDVLQEKKWMSMNSRKWFSPKRVSFQPYISISEADFLNLHPRTRLRHFLSFKISSYCSLSYIWFMKVADIAKRCSCLCAQVSKFSAHILSGWCPRHLTN